MYVYSDPYPTPNRTDAGRLAATRSREPSGEPRDPGRHVTAFMHPA